MERVLFVFVALAALPLSAHAYFDPGAGAVFLQLLIAAGIGVVYKLRHFVGNILRVIRDLFKR